MPNEHPIEIFMPPNMLKAKVGGRIVGVDMAAIRRAEQALTNLKTEFDDWLGADVTTLAASHESYRKAPDKSARAALYRASHDLRGQALTFEFPLVARVATSLCKLLDGAGDKVPAPLIDAHVGAIRVIVRQNIRNADDGTANNLADELDARVEECLAKAPSNP